MKHNNRNSVMVKNINGTSKPKYVIPDLKTKFEKAGGNFHTCSHKGCCNKPSATAHVMKTDGRSSNDWQLTALCAKHNHPSNTNEIALRKNAKLVSVRSINKKK